jgi:hypothetical protein
MRQLAKTGLFDRVMSEVFMLKPFTEFRKIYPGECVEYYGEYASPRNGYTHMASMTEYFYFRYELTMVAPFLLSGDGSRSIKEIGKASVTLREAGPSPLPSQYIYVSKRPFL